MATDLGLRIRRESQNNAIADRHATGLSFLHRPVTILTEKSPEYQLQRLTRLAEQKQWQPLYFQHSTLRPGAV
jgi:hypothetical protein